MQLANYKNVLKRPFVLVLYWLAALSVSRLVLMGIHWDRVSETGGAWFILFQGFRFDLILVACLLGAIFLLKPWFHTVGLLRRFGAWLFPLCAAFATATAFFVEASTASFIKQFDSRPNYLFVEYLEYPREVLSTLLGTRPLELILFTLLAFSLAWLVFRWLRRDPQSSTRISPWFCLLVTPFIAVVIFALIRSTTDHRPINPSNAAFSQDSMINQLPLNSPYSVLHAIYERKKEGRKARIRYGRMPDEEVLGIILNEAGISPGQQVDPGVPTLHRQTATFERARPLNLVIVLEESLGAQFVGSLGGKDLTPNIDGWADEGIWFERLYATGIRSARGIEAVITGFTPSPRSSVIKGSDTQMGFFTLAGLLESHGYHTSFIYGGESHFDNMRRFFLNNGFQTVIDENDYPDPVYYGSWGMSDEDLFTRAHEELSAIGDQPFFSLIFTTSHHEPFDIPAGRVTESKYGPRETSIKYADYAVGQFIETARQSDYWDNTVFLIIADHNARVYGENLVPVHKYHIPAVIIGPTIEPRRIPGITSQIDILPTLLSLIGLSSEHPAIGRDLTLPEFKQGSGRAMMQFHANQAYLEDERVVAFQPEREPQSYLLEQGVKLVPDPQPDLELERRALAYALWGPLTLRNKAYRD